MLAYQYLTQGYFDDAAKMLKQVVALKPNDTLSAKLLEQLEAAQQNPDAGPPQAAPPRGPRSPVPVEHRGPRRGDDLRDLDRATERGYRDRPDDPARRGVPLGGHQKGQTQQFSGTSTFGGGILTLVPDKAPPIVGRVSWTDPNHMTFRVVGDSPDAPGLSFSK